MALTPNGMELSNLRDFTWTFDARLVNAADHAGFGVQFRHVADDQGSTLLGLIVGVDDGHIELNRNVNGVARRIAQADSPAVDTTGGVNRITVQAIGGDVRVNVNGQDVLQAQDDTPQAGALRFGAFSQGQTPPVFNFDNILATAPGSS
jgi:hypothetical protein